MNTFTFFILVHFVILQQIPETSKKREMLLLVPEAEKSNVRAQHLVMAFTLHLLMVGGR